MKAFDIDYKKLAVLLTPTFLRQSTFVAFVRALCQPCSFLLLDEPVSHLDPENADIMSQMVAERQQADGLALIVTSVGHRFPYEYTRIFKL